MSVQQSFIFNVNPESLHTAEPEKILKDVFGYDTFRPLQKEVIQNVLDGRDTLAVMPTGGGKSLCYEIPALLMDGLTVVVSPLIALMQDQVAQLEAVGVPAVFLNSSLDWDSYVSACDRIVCGEIRLLYVSPEGLNTERIRNVLHSSNVCVRCITIDEAHCISEWGHDFRPDYMEIASVREQFPQAVCLALTATATKAVRDDIIMQLKMENPAVLIASFNRPNLFLEVKMKANPSGQVESFLNEHKDESGIIYCFSRKQVDELTSLLKSRGFNAESYHAGLSDAQRYEHQRNFINGKVEIMVATVAFGMGINKPDVRFVIHYDMPKSVEQYYQEIGRAGRDGLPSHALLLYSLGDLHKIRFFFTEKDNPAQAERLLRGMIRYAECRSCRRKALLSYFGEVYDGKLPDSCCCDVCAAGPLPLADVTILAQKFMSCILRTKERYGASYVIDVLLGARTSRLLENGHDSLTTFGIGKELTRENWFELSSTLASEGYIEKTDDYGILYLTEYGRKVLFERAEIKLPIEFKKHALKKSAGIKTLSSSGYDKDLAMKIKAWRRRKADEENVAPYVIFGDRTLIEIAKAKPHNIEEFMQCYGIGQAKAHKYGPAIIQIVDSSS
ncbi:MAG: DNA helicase RecQ [Treponema sp.]|nr:DNA helicase RecQ [Treponema sp.]